MALKTVGQPMMFFTAEGNRCWLCGERLGQVGGSDLYEFQWSIEITTSHHATAYVAGFPLFPRASPVARCLMSWTKFRAIKDAAAASAQVIARDSKSHRSACAALTALNHRTDNPDAQALLLPFRWHLPDPGPDRATFAGYPRPPVPVEQAWADAMECRFSITISATICTSARGVRSRDMLYRVLRLLAGTRRRFCHSPGLSVVVAAIWRRLSFWRRHGRRGIALLRAVRVLRRHIARARGCARC